VFLNVLGYSAIFASITVSLLCWSNKLLTFTGENTKMVHINGTILYIIGVFLFLISDIMMLNWISIIINTVLLILFLYFYKIQKKDWDDKMTNLRMRA
jgi:hypothetical protein